MKRFENLEEALCKELEKLDKKYGSDAGEMNVQDVERADVLYHALKSAATYNAMEGEGWEEEDMEGSGEGRSYRNGRGGGSGRSYARRGRDSMGRFTSREMGPGGYSGYYSGEYSGMPWMPPYRY